MEYIDRLGEVKDRALEFYGTDSRSSSWANTIKEVYYNVVVSWELLKGMSRGARALQQDHHLGYTQRQGSGLK